MEPWIENFINELNKNKVAPVNISRGVKIIQLERGILYKDKTINDNPYFWSNTENYKIAMLNIKNALQDKDTKNRDIYEKNFNDLIKEIDGYEKELKNITEQLKDYTFIVDGDELDYFIKNYGLNSLKLYNYGLVLTEEDKKKISDLEEKIKGNNNIIFLYDNEEKLKANDFLIKKYNINTLNIISYKDDINYKDMLKYNLKNLETLLQNIQLKEESKKADVNQ
jgi:ABC-type Zn uptake system ZnuABC Zn-binding protein ZnuA